eukprot:TRINITY_DN36694_c0_g1_i1.p1 TRINITY_DN36694_c0_g1~~TRINITY_DN36694_c0_g1_i1.p1  ORF type:complete len:779 (-),score=292.01 TRINITY_DN36694_c0_g1_i1:150-2486(-)
MADDVATADQEQEEGAEQEQIDVKSLLKQWRLDTLDLHRVMGCAKHLFMLLEQENEALLRVALEITLCKKARKVLWWIDGWWSDEDKREELKGMVKSRLEMLVGRMGNSSFSVDDEANAAALAKYSAEASKQKARADALQEQLDKQERTSHELRLALDDSERLSATTVKRAEAAEQGADKLREMLKELQQKLDSEAGKSDDMAERERRQSVSNQRVTDLEARLKEQSAKAEEREAELARRLAEAEKRAKAGVGGDSSKELAEAKKRYEKAEQENELLQRQIKDLQDRLAKAKAAGAAGAGGAPDPDAEAKLRALQEELAQAKSEVKEERRRSRLLEAEVAKDPGSAQELDEARKELEAVRQQLKAAQDEVEQKNAELKLALAKLAGAANRDGSDAQSSGNGKGSTEKEKALEVELSAARKAEEEARSRMDKMSSKIERQKATIEQLTQEKIDIDTKLTNALRALRNLKEQIKKLEEIAEKKGYGNLVQEIMRESNLRETLDNPEFTIFDRLYEDALRRQAKYKEQQAALLAGGSTGKDGYSGGAAGAQRYNYGAGGYSAGYLGGSDAQAGYASVASGGASFLSADDAQRLRAENEELRARLLAATTGGLADPLPPPASYKKPQAPSGGPSMHASMSLPSLSAARSGRVLVEETELPPVRAPVPVLSAELQHRSYRQARDALERDLGLGGGVEGQGLLQQNRPTLPWKSRGTGLPPSMAPTASFGAGARQQRDGARGPQHSSWEGDGKAWPSRSGSSTLDSLVVPGLGLSSKSMARLRT